VLLTFPDAAITTDAAVFDPLDLRFERETFWVVAPGAFQGAPFEKHGGADARSVFSGKPLEMQYGSGDGTRRIAHFAC
jgi:hypothetical protein